MKINGVELEDLDIFDLDVAGKYENALKNVEDMSEKVKGMTVAESIRTQCNAVFNVFNELFGEGTDKKVFGNKVNLLTCLKAFEELVIQMNEQKSEIEKIASKYSPNRAQRRKK
ncbi:DUF6673 family protein [Clostridium cadaveris]|uniref:DUF6673 family protein n=1 Tax=Clostridium cadaveris TaxID=1529 RepID=UPI00040E6B85|nr:DUF6673 family protein [Clostridium cadaveris]